MKERLIELLRNIPPIEATVGGRANGKTYKTMEHIADYLLANGVIVLPCKVGDEVWAIRDYRGTKYAQRGFVSEMFFRKDMSIMIVVKHIARGTWGEDIFPTPEEAEKALKRSEGK